MATPAHSPPSTLTDDQTLHDDHAIASKIEREARKFRLSIETAAHNRSVLVDTLANMSGRLRTQTEVYAARKGKGGKKGGKKAGKHDETLAVTLAIDDRTSPNLAPPAPCLAPPAAVVIDALPSVAPPAAVVTDTLAQWQGAMGQHWLVLQLGFAAGTLFDQLCVFCEGRVSMSELPGLLALVAQFKFIMIIERWIESQHAQLKKTLAHTRKAGCAHIAYSSILRPLRDYLETVPDAVRVLARHCNETRNTNLALGSVGLQNHPSICFILQNFNMDHRVLHRKFSSECTEIIYHFDTGTLFRPLPGVEAEDDDDGAMGPMGPRRPPPPPPPPPGGGPSSGSGSTPGGQDGQDPPPPSGHVPKLPGASSSLAAAPTLVDSKFRGVGIDVMM